METIFAQASSYGKAGVSVYRLSGPQAAMVLQTLTKRSLPKARKLTQAKIYNPTSGKIIDKALIVFFPKPASFTGEDVAEIHAHGSLAIAKMLFEEVLKIKNVRLAEPGEFAKRAFFNGKMDLVEAEGLADLIDAETAAQHEQAIKHGELAKLYRAWKDKVLAILAFLEAAIDFPDEDIPGSLVQESCELASDLGEEIRSHLSDQRRGERLRNGLKLGIFGKPNVGKSSLMNYLSQREISIVSSTPGTTRDILESNIDIGGYPIILADTAGIREEAEGAIEAIGISRAIELFASCDIKVLLLDTSDGTMPPEISPDEYTIVAFNKVDLAWPKYGEHIKISCKTLQGMEELVGEIIKKAQAIAAPLAKPTLTRPRYRQKLEDALMHIKNALANNQVVLIAEELRLAANCMRAIIGEVSTEEVLDVIFANFCIGK